MPASSSGSGSEARNHPRYAIRKIASYSYAGKRFLTLTMDLGLDGMRIETSEHLSKGASLDIQLVLGRKSICPRGEVVYSHVLSEGRYVSGVEFVESSEKDRRRLRGYLTTLKEQKRGWPDGLLGCWKSDRNGGLLSEEAKGKTWVGDQGVKPTSGFWGGSQWVHMGHLSGI